jgi:hypothetical protein
MDRVRTIIVAVVIMLLSLGAIVACDTGGPPAVQPTATTSAEEPTATSEPEEDPTATSEPEEDPTPTTGSADDWFTYESESGGFTAEFPRRPTEQSDVNSSPELGDINIFAVEAKDSGSTYSVVYLDYPDKVIEAADPETLLEKVFKEVVKENKVDDQDMTTVNGFPSLRGLFQMGRSGYARYQSVLAGNRIFQVISVSPDETEGEEDAQRFHRSFKLLDGSAQATPTRAGRATPTRGTSNPGDWVPVTSDAGEFNVLMPNAPRENTSNTTAGGMELELFNFVSTEGDVEYTLVYVDYPQEAVASLDPRELLQNAFGGVHGTNEVAAQEEIDVQGNPGLLAEFDSTSGYVWYKSIIRENRLYQLIVIAPEKEGNEEDAMRFLDSFEITGAGSSAQPTAAAGRTPASTGERSGMTGLNNTVRFTITDIKHDDGGSAVLKPDDGNEYLLLSVTIENTGDKEEHISTFFANIKDSEGNEHDATYGPHVVDPLDGAVAPGATIEGMMGFEVPEDATGLVFVYDPPLDDNTLELQLDR